MKSIHRARLVFRSTSTKIGVSSLALLLIAAAIAWPQTQLAFASPTDIDNDSVVNATDRDYDNDGITNTVEGCSYTASGGNDTGLTGNPTRFLSYPFTGNYNPNPVSIAPIIITTPTSSVTPIAANNITASIVLASAKLQVQDVAAMTLAEAKTNNEYLQYSFTTQSTLPSAEVSTAGFFNSTLVANSGFGVTYGISSDGGTSFTDLATFTEPAHAATGGTFPVGRRHAVTNYDLKANTTYTVRIYLYALTAASTYFDDAYIAFNYCGTDTDGDGIADARDLDSDNDGISDLIESGQPATRDINNDGMVDGGIGTDGIPLAAGAGQTPINTDGDARPNYLDLDSDNDSIPDTVEARPTASYIANDSDVRNDDTDGDGVVSLAGSTFDNTTSFGGTFVAPVDTDGDGTPDYLDLNSDGDPLTDAVESGLTPGTDANGDGIGDGIGASYADPDGSINNPSTALANQYSNTTEVGYREVPIPTVNTLTTNDNRPPLTGSTSGAPASSTVTVVVNSVSYTATNNGNGTWTLANDTIATALPDGVYSVAVTIDGMTDTTSNELTIDTTQPLVTINTPATATPTNASSYPVSGTCTIGDGTVTITIAGASPNPQTAACSSTGTFSTTVDVTGIADGTGVIVIDASQTDVAGNTGNATQRTADKDTVAPGIPTVTPKTTTDTTPSLSGTLPAPTTATDVVKVTVNGIEYTATNNGDGTWTLADNTITASLADGTYPVTVVVTDAAGNASTDVTTNELIIDTVAPTVTINQAAGQADPTTVNSATFSIVLSEPVTSLTASSITLSGTTGTVTTLTKVDDTHYTAIVTGMTSGNTVTATVVAGALSDAAGNTNTASTSTDNQVTYDATAPSLAITRKPLQPAYTATNSAWFTLTLSEPIIDGTLTAGDINPGTTTGTVTTLTKIDDTHYEFEVTGMTSGETTTPTVAAGSFTDLAGNTNTASTGDVNNWVLYDTTPPAGFSVNVDISSGLDTPVISWSTTDGESGLDHYEISYDGGSFTTVSGTQSPALTPAASHTVTVRAYDRAGNMTERSVTYPPAITITAPTTLSNAPITDTTITVTGPAGMIITDVTIGGAGVSGFTCTPTPSASAVVPITCSGGTISSTTTLTVTATTNTAITTSNSQDYVIDSVQPTVTVNQGPVQTDPTNVDSATFRLVFSKLIDESTLSASDVTLIGTTGTVTSLTKIDNYTWDIVVTGMTSGDTVTATLPAGRITDTAGNANTASTSTDNAVTYDTTQPLVTINTPATATPTNASSYPVSGTCTIGDGTVTITIAGASPNPQTAACSSTGTFSTTVDVTGIADGTGVIVIDASQTDVAGNTGNATQRTADKDTVAPGIPTVTPKTTTDTTPSLSGTLPAPTTATDVVKVTVNGIEYTATNNGDGTWTLADNTITAALTPGTYDVTVTVTDAAGNASTDITTSELVIDAMPPSPTLTITSHIDNTLVVNNKTTLEGVCIDGRTVTIIEPSLTPNPTVGACVGGRYAIPLVFVAGAHTNRLEVTQTDGTGHVLSAYVTLRFDDNDNGVINEDDQNSLVNTGTNVLIIASGALALIAVAAWLLLRRRPQRNS